MDVHPIPPPSHARLTELCLALTKELHELPEVKDDSRVVTFVGAYCGDSYSKYVNLSRMLEHPIVEQRLCSRFIDLPKPIIFNNGIRLGSIIGELQQSPPSDQIELPAVLNGVSSWSDEEHCIFSNAAPIWRKAAISFLKTLEAIRFKNSVLLTQFDSEACNHFELNWLPHTLSAIIRNSQRDQVYEYGVICETMIFEAFDNLHYCWLPGAPPEGDGRYALCLWSSKRVANVVEKNKDAYREIIQTFWEGAEKVPKLRRPSRENVGEVRANIKARIGSYKHIENVSPGELEEQSARLIQLKSAIDNCSVFSKLEEVFRSLPKISTKDDLKNLKLKEILRFLEGAS